MKKLLFIVFLFAVLFFTACSANKIGNRGAQNYEQRAVEKNAEKAFKELDREIEEKNNKEEGKHSSLKSESWYLSWDDCAGPWLCVPAYLHKSNGDFVTLLSVDNFSLSREMDDGLFIFDATEDLFSYRIKKERSGWFKVTPYSSINTEQFKYALCYHLTNPDNLLIQNLKKVVVLFREGKEGSIFLKVLPSVKAKDKNYSWQETHQKGFRQIIKEKNGGKILVFRH